MLPAVADGSRWQRDIALPPHPLQQQQ